MEKRKIAVRQIHGRWQPVDSAGWIARGEVYNADGNGYATKEAAEEAAAMLRQIPVELTPCDECGRPTTKGPTNWHQCTGCIQRHVRGHATMKKPPKDVEAAVHAAQLYIGSDQFSPVRDQQKLYNQMQKKIAAVAKKRGMAEHIVGEQITAEAKRRGGLRPLPGKHI